MGRIAVVVSTERVVDEGAHGLDVKCDPDEDGDPIVVPHFAPAGDDAPPLPGDAVALEESSGTGEEQVSGYYDTRNAGVAANGEKRIYARDPSGNVVAEIHLKGSGSIRVENAEGYFEIKDNGSVDINGVTIDPLGNIVAPGEVTAMSASVAIPLSKHAHPTAAPGSPSPPIPGPPPPPEQP